MNGFRRHTNKKCNVCFRKLWITSTGKLNGKWASIITSGIGERSTLLNPLRWQVTHQLSASVLPLHKARFAAVDYLPDKIPAPQYPVLLSKNNEGRRYTYMQIFNMKIFYYNERNMIIIRENNRVFNIIGNRCLFYSSPYTENSVLVNKWRQFDQWRFCWEVFTAGKMMNFICEGLLLNMF